ncbi:MAG: TolB family protein [Candidatus Aminicenantaceae bacterium]
MRHTKSSFTRLATAFLLMMIPMAAYGQGATDIYLVRMKVSGEKYTLSKSVKINPNEGYNNQPSFHPDGGSVLYSSQSGTNTDIYRYDIETGKTMRLTNTPESEYSPIVMPDGDRFSVIQLVIYDGPRKGAQPLIAFPLTGGGSELIYEEGEKVGYHAWIDPHKVAMFILGAPNFLRIADLKNVSSKRIAENIGRSLYKIPDMEAISFSQSQEGGGEVIMKYDLVSNKTQSIVPMLEGNSFYAWTPDGALIMGVGAKLYRVKPGTEKKWHEIGDLESFGVHGISRLAIGPDMRWLAVVDSPGTGR